MSLMRQPAVFLMGPGLDVRGGISAVERMLMKSTAAGLPMRHVATMVEGSVGRKLGVFARALLATLVSVRRGDVAHIHFASGASSRRKMLIARLASRRGARVILHAHGGGYRRYWARISSLERSYTLRTLQRAHGLIVLGAAWREFFAALGVPRENITVLPNPVALPKDVPARPERARVRFVYLGLVARHKGAFDLVEALARLPPPTGAAVELVVAGNGALAELRGLAERLGLGSRIEVLDWLAPEDRDRLLAQADAFVLPSYGEGLPMSMLEAMAWGLPVICTPVGSIPEYVLHESNGLLVQPGAIGELSDAIARLVRDPAMRVRLGRSARATVEPLDAGIYAHRMAAIYRSAATDTCVAGQPDATRQ